MMTDLGAVIANALFGVVEREMSVKVPSPRIMSADDMLDLLHGGKCVSPGANIESGAIKFMACLKHREITSGMRQEQKLQKRD